MIRGPIAAMTRDVFRPALEPQERLMIIADVVRHANAADDTVAAFQDAIVAAFQEGFTQGYADAQTDAGNGSAPESESPSGGGSSR